MLERQNFLITIRSERAKKAHPKPAHDHQPQNNIEDIIKP